MKLYRIIFSSMITFGLIFSGFSPASAQDDEPPEIEETEEVEGAAEGEDSNPVVDFLSGLTGEDVAGMHIEGAGLGNIAKAFAFQQAGGAGDMLRIMEQAQEKGWGNMYKEAQELGGDPGKKHGLGWLMKASGEKGPKDKDAEWTGGPPEHANNDKDKIPPGQAKNKSKNKDKSGDSEVEVEPESEETEE
ncbi:MAG: hypothetical protein JEZ06_22975 [Anaerolineaceae bacterium]|nr:hypothetical protein [Anaerolineaceae bacterium]